MVSKIETGERPSAEDFPPRLDAIPELDTLERAKFWCVLDEGVMHRDIGGSKIMRPQLDRLADLAEHPKVTIQVIPGAGAHAGLLAHFVIADLDGKPPMVYLETAAEGQVTDSPSVGLPRLDQESSVLGGHTVSTLVTCQRPERLPRPCTRKRTGMSRSA